MVPSEEASGLKPESSTLIPKPTRISLDGSYLSESSEASWMQKLERLEALGRCPDRGLYVGVPLQWTFFRRLVERP